MTGHYCLGRYDDAVEAMRQATVLVPADPSTQAFLSWALGLAGQRDEALAIRTDLERRRTQVYCSGFFMALTYIGLSERDQAISWLQKAAEERDLVMPQINVNPGVDPLRAAPRFQALLRRMKFPEATATGAAEAP